MLNLSWRSWISAFFNKRCKPRRVSMIRPRFRPQLEQLELRLAPATLTVSSVADTNNRDNFLTFREALMVTQGALPVANLTKQEQAQIVGKLAVPGTPDTIKFAIGNAQQTIQ